MEFKSVEIKNAFYELKRGFGANMAFGAITATASVFFGVDQLSSIVRDPNLIHKVPIEASLLASGILAATAVTNFLIARKINKTMNKILQS